MLKKIERILEIVSSVDMEPNGAEMKKLYIEHITYLLDQLKLEAKKGKAWDWLLSFEV